VLLKYSRVVSQHSGVTEHSVACWRPCGATSSPCWPS